MVNFYNIFYWLTVSDGIKHFFDGASDLFTTVAVISFIATFICSAFIAYTKGDNKLKNEEDDKNDPTLRGWTMISKYALRIFYISLSLAITTWFGFVATPTKTDCLLIIAGGAVGNFLTSDSSSKKIPAELAKFVHLSLQKEVKDLNADVKRQLGIQTPKERLIDKAKKMTKDELINYLNSDSTINSVGK